jgi:hypothetical protein
LFFCTVPPAHTLVRWVNEYAFVSIVQTRPCPTFGRPVHRRGRPHRLRPGTSPQALRIPPCGGHPALRSTARGGSRSALAVSGFRLRARVGGFHTFRTSPASEALPPLLDMALLIRAPEGLQPSRTTRCSAHTTELSDFLESFVIGVRLSASRCGPRAHRPRPTPGSPGSRAWCFRACPRSLTARGPRTSRPGEARGVAFR